MSVKLYPITYRCWGGLKLTYNLTNPSYLGRLKATLPQGIIIWKMWFREAFFLVSVGRCPTPTMISDNVWEDIARGLHSMRVRGLIV